MTTTTNKETKKTKRNYFEELKAVVENSTVDNQIELIDFINHELELLNRKRSTSKKVDEFTQHITEVVKGILPEYGHGLTVTNIMMSSPELSLEKGVNTSKITSILVKLVEQGYAVRTVEKKKALYSRAQS